MDWEELRDRKAVLANAELVGWGPQVRSEIKWLEGVEREMRWYAKQRDKLLALTSDPREAHRLWSVELDRFGDSGQRLRTFKGELIRRELVDAAEANKIETEYIDPERVQAAREAYREGQAIDKAITEVLAAVGQSRRSEAMGIYNRSDAPKDWDKVDSWCRALVTEGLLGIEWLPGSKLGNRLHQLRKMLSGKSLPGYEANKAMEGPAHNK